MDRHRAEVIIHACHDAWSAGDLKRMFAYYNPNVLYTCNTLVGDGFPQQISGRDAMRDFLVPMLDEVECLTVVEAFHFTEDTARAMIAVWLRHLSTGIELSGQFRQVFRFDEFYKIVSLEEFHDAAKLRAFWQLVHQTEAAARSSGA